MDDIGALFWRFGKKLIGSDADTDIDTGHRPASQAGDHKPPPAPPSIVHSPAAE
jgi:hypothetical protein